MQGKTPARRWQGTERGFTLNFTYASRAGKEHEIYSKLNLSYSPLLLQRIYFLLRSVNNGEDIR